MPRRVVFVHRVSCDYSKAFLVQLHERLRLANIEFTVVSGAPWPGEGLVDILSELSFGIRCDNVRIVGPLYWARGVMAAIDHADLVIFEQLSSSIHLYPVLGRRVTGHRRRVAFYGHGATLSARSSAFARAWKRFLARQVDWWFAYTQISAAAIERSGFARNKITVFQNTIDVRSLRLERDKLTCAGLSQLRRSLFGDARVMPTGVFCGRLVELKSIPFLMRSLDRIHAKHADFRMVIVGDGPDRSAVEAFCRENPWCVWVGSQRDAARVPYLALADVWLNPGSTGLAIVDALAMGLPFVTTENSRHCPEIAYLNPGLNGLITRPDFDAFADEIVRLMSDPGRLSAMKRQAYEDGGNYTAEQMAERVADGVLHCLKQA
jgi:glycosyltransferase involved in cell wall biosynthesis